MKNRSSLLQVSTFFAVLLSFQLGLANTQTTTPTTDSLTTKPRVDTRSSGIANGMFVDAIYSVLKSEGTQDSYVANPTVILNETIYTVGVGAGYRDLRPNKIGFEIGAQVTQDAGRSIGGNHTFLQLNGSVTYSVLTNIYGFGGPSINYLQFNNNDSLKNGKSSPGLGGQVGVGYFNRGFFGKISYQYMPYISQLDYNRSTGGFYSVNNDFTLSGVVTQVGYNF